MPGMSEALKKGKVPLSPAVKANGFVFVSGLPPVDTKTGKKSSRENSKVYIMGNQISQKPFSQRQLRVGELVKQSLGELFIRNEAKIPSINSKLITVTEVRMTPDLKTARVYVIPLGGIDTKETVRILTEYSHLVRKALSKRLDIKFLPKLTFVEDNSFEYAEKIEKIIKKIKENDKEKKRYN